MKTTQTANGLTVSAYRGDNSVLFAFDLLPTLTAGLAGFSIRRTSPDGKQTYLLNRLSFTVGITAATTPGQRLFTPSDQAPFQKFNWIDFPPVVQAGLYQYDVAALYFGAPPATSLRAGATVSLSMTLVPPPAVGPVTLGFTRGYLSSQAYAEQFNNAPIRPVTQSIDYDTTPFQAQYAWLGGHARQLLFAFVAECLADPTVTIDLFAYDLNEPDFLRQMAAFGPRLRAVLDDAPLHTGATALEPHARQLLQTSAGSSHVLVGHFTRFAHDKIVVKRVNGTPVAVLTGSTNFSVRGLYVQANNMLVIRNAAVAARYGEAFNTAFTNMAGFTHTPIAGQWFSFPDLPTLSVSFAPHASASISLDRVSQAIMGAKKTVFFAVMELTGGGDVLNELRTIADRPGVFSYGISQTSAGLNIFKPGMSNGVFAAFSYLSTKVPAPFRAEWDGGLGQVIHHKFVVIDFNSSNPIVFAGSSNLAAGGEEQNGDNLLAITDPDLVTAYAIEAIRLVDHYHFRTVMAQSTTQTPLQLQGPVSAGKLAWWQPYYDPQQPKYNVRLNLR